MTEEAPGFRYDRVTLTLVLAFCMMVAGLSLNAVLSELRSELHLSATMTTLHGSMFGVGLLIAGLLGRPAIAKVGRKKAIYLAAMLIFSGTTVFSLGHHVAITLLGAASIAFGAATVVMVAPGIIADHYGDQRGEAFAVINGLPGLAAVPVALILGWFIAEGLSWRGPFLIIGLLMLIALLIAGLPARLPATQPVTTVSVSAFQLLVRRPDVRRLWFVVVIAVSTEFPPGVWGGTFLHEIGGASAGLASALSCIYGIGLFSSRMILPRLLGLFGANLRIAGLLMMSASGIALWAIPNLPLRAACLFIMGFGGGPLYPVSIDNLFTIVDIDTVSLGAVGALASGTAVTIGPVLFGVVADAVSLRHAVLIVPVFASAVIAVLLRQSAAAHRLTARLETIT